MGGFMGGTGTGLKTVWNNIQAVNTYGRENAKLVQAAREAARGGIKGSALDAAARNIITDAGYGEYFVHALSHGLGIEIHEPPNASPSADAILPAGAVISNEPGIYIPGRFGVRLEDVLHLTEDGCEDITKLSKELTVICA